MIKPTANVNMRSGAACLYMTTEYPNDSKEPKTIVSLYWHSGIPAQPWAAVSIHWHDELRSPPWRVEVAVDPYAPVSEKYAILAEGIKTYGHSIVNLKVVTV